MNNKMLKGLVEAGAVKAVSIIANGSVVHAEILTLSGDKKVITTQAGAIKTWGTIDSTAKWLKTLGLGTMKLEAWSLKLGIGKWVEESTAHTIVDKNGLEYFMHIDDFSLNLTDVTFYEPACDDN